MDYNNYNNDSGSFGMAVLGFFFPIVGWFYWGFKHLEKPKTAHDAALGAWIGFAVNLLLYCACAM